MLTIQVKFLETDTLEDCVKQATEFARRNNCCVETHSDYRNYDFVYNPLTGEVRHTGHMEGDFKS